MLSILFTLYTLTVISVFMIVSFVALVVCYPFDKKRFVVHKCSEILCMMFWYCPPLWKREVEGLSYIRKDRPYVIVINHNSMLDIFALYFLPLVFKWVSKKEVFRIPLVGTFLWMHGDIAIDRKQGTQAMKKVLEQGCDWLGKGCSVALFPEGTRSKDGEIQRFKSGAFALAQKAGVDILPVVMLGTRDIFRHDKSFRVNWKLKLKIRVLPPLPIEEIQELDTQATSDTIRRQMVETLQQMKLEK